MALVNHFPTTSLTLSRPFEIKKAPSGAGPNTDNSYYIENGICFSSFSFDTGSFVPIQGLGTGTSYVLEDDKKFFIDISILPNLQVSGASIRCETVGADGDFWKNYPNMIEIKPEDEVDEDGRVVKLIDGKVQTNCYVLIGYRADDQTKNGPTPTETLLKNPIQILDTNIILLASVVSGVPVIFPAPYFNGQSHLNAVQKF
jgi:hypothetical protein